MTLRLSKYISATTMVLEQSNQIGFDPMASTAFLAGERLEVTASKCRSGDVSSTFQSCQHVFTCESMVHIGLYIGEVFFSQFAVSYS